jgi:hypothetical protein
LESAERADSAGRASNPFLPQGASVCLNDGVFTTGPGRVPVLHFRTVGLLSNFLDDAQLCTTPQIHKSSGTIRRKLIRRESFRPSILRPTLATTRCEIHCTGILRLNNAFVHFDGHPENLDPNLGVSWPQRYHPQVTALQSIS